MNPKLSPLFKKLEALYLSCLNCKKKLDPKRIQRLNPRCKKCEREYANIWPNEHEEFYKMFEGQH